MIKPVYLFVSMQMLYLGFCLSAFSQSIENVKATFGEGKVTLSYDLLRTDPNQSYFVEVFGSHNNYSSALKTVTGDVGSNIKGGTGKKITWDVKTDLVTYKGEITFRVKGNPVAAWVFKNPTDGGSVRRGKSTVIQWEGGSPQQAVTVELYRGSEKMETLAPSNTGNSFTWSVPKDFEKGKYAIKLSSGGQNITSGTFSVKAKVPLLLIVLPVAIVGGVAAVLGGGSGGGETPPASDLPAAPDPN
jgi:hypothetical protein